MAGPVSIAGSLASIAGFGTTLAQWWNKRRDDEKKATLEHYLEWLRRQDHADLLQQIKASQDASDALSRLIEELKTASDDHAADLLSQLKRQSKQLMSIDDKLVRSLSAIDELPDRVQAWLRPLAKRLQEAIDRLPAPSTPSTEDQEYEESYRKAIAQNLDEVELFGVDVPPEARQQALSAAYISLSLGSVSADKAGGPTPAEQVFDHLRPAAGRLLIRGDAGSGKTTLMRWAAIRAARRNDAFDGDL